MKARSTKKELKNKKALINKDFLKRYSLVIAAGVIIFIAEIGYFTYQSYPESLYYPLKQVYQNYLIAQKKNDDHLGRANIYLDESKRIFTHLQELVNRGNFTSSLASSANGLVDQENQAIKEMSHAKTAGKDVTSQVKTLCDQLTKQSDLLTKALAKVSNSKVKDALTKAKETTLSNLGESSGW